MVLHCVFHTFGFQLIFHKIQQNSTQLLNVMLHEAIERSQGKCFLGFSPPFCYCSAAFRQHFVRLKGSLEESAPSGGVLYPGLRLIVKRKAAAGCCVGHCCELLSANTCPCYSSRPSGSMGSICLSRDCKGDVGSILSQNSLFPHILKKKNRQSTFLRKTND